MSGWLFSVSSGVQGIRRIMLDEYPEKAIREAIVNAITHRDYEDASRHIKEKADQQRVPIADMLGTIQ